MEIHKIHSDDRPFYIDKLDETFEVIRKAGDLAYNAQYDCEHRETIKFASDIFRILEPLAREAYARKRAKNKSS